MCLIYVVCYLSKRNILEIKCGMLFHFCLLFMILNLASQSSALIYDQGKLKLMIDRF